MIAEAVKGPPPKDSPEYEDWLRQLRGLQVQGSDLFGVTWDAVRHRLVAAATGGETASASDLDYDTLRGLRAHVRRIETSVTDEDFRHPSAMEERLIRAVREDFGHAEEPVGPDEVPALLLALNKTPLASCGLGPLMRTVLPRLAALPEGDAFLAVQSLTKEEAAVLLREAQDAKLAREMNLEGVAEGVVTALRGVRDPAMIQRIKNERWKEMKRIFEGDDLEAAKERVKEALSNL